MKKLRLHKLFHWLYAFLMLMPIISFLGYFLLCFGKLEPDLSNIGTWVASYSFFFFGSGTTGTGVAGSIRDVFSYIVTDMMGLHEAWSDVAVDFLSYWVDISLLYLCFDVLMYPINLFHRWLDDGGIE